VKRKNHVLAELAAYGPPPRRLRPWPVVAVVVLLLAAGAAAWYVTAGTGTASAPGGRHPGRAHPQPVIPLTVVGTSPAAGATGVASDATIAVRFSAPLPRVLAAGAVPTLVPPVAGGWRRSDRFTLEFDAAAPLVPSSNETMSIPGGPAGVHDAAGRILAATVAVSFTIARGSEERLQQLLALTGYIPLTFTPSGPAPAPAEAATPQAGTFAWRWSGLPGSLTSLWVEGEPSAITKGAVMALESQNGLAVDASAGPKVWSVLLDDVAKGATNKAPSAYVDVSKVLPESLTVWVNGVPAFQNIPVNTGAPGADTPDGTYEVFEHVTASEMKGTNPDGTTYDDPNVPWASYFNGGDALHGFVRASYGSPQSNGCVEMTVANAGATWGYTPIGTLVTVEGPPVR
jgi:peptidoglycan hydrolase-like protein with peptidoglycan-binding domain